MVKGVAVKSDYSNNNILTIIQRDDGDIVFSLHVGDDHDRTMHFATTQGGTRLKNSSEIINHFSAIIDLLSDDSQRDDVVRVLR